GAEGLRHVLEDVAAEEHVERPLELLQVRDHAHTELLTSVARAGAAELEPHDLEAGALELPAPVSPRGPEVEDAIAFAHPQRRQERDALAEVFRGAGEAAVEQRLELRRRRAVGGEPLLVVILVELVAEAARIGGRTVEELARRAAVEGGEQELALDSL